MSRRAVRLDREQARHSIRHVLLAVDGAEKAQSLVMLF